MGIIIDGKRIAAEIKEAMRKRVESLKEKGVQPRLVIVLIGDNAASQVYVKNKINACNNAGIHAELVKFSSATTDEILAFLKKVNEDPSVHGIITQLPFPPNIDEDTVLSSINPKKDVDCLNPVNAGKLALGIDAIAPCTPKGIMKMLDYMKVDIKGKNVVIINRSRIVGRPLSFLMLNRHATVTICHSKTADIPKHTKEADIVVVAVGKPGFLKKDMIKSGSVVIDVGINKVGGKICGDADFDVMDKASFITPVPGGVGPMTVAMVLENTVMLAEKFGGTHD
ncbi:MAG: bifunctional 5,10-methylenetetrahydrofolate dehydrogenase/5,10-methenyltetrahydrofolate cyclohydrolase [Candidatus Aenigmarchaeota archaeon]|nr:bifunctional 5,10-methylenetetrahydrofolate dehydrogenase/5,10-methenyltetrahydrofolate cyclohydrolase [Candidatus Aenigmarchaeota archaeon]